jgi:hypothetical protein
MQRRVIAVALGSSVLAAVIGVLVDPQSFVVDLLASGIRSGDSGSV